VKVEINVLGTLEVTIAGISVVPTAKKPSQILAMLALNAGHVVTATSLMEEVWDLNPPRSAASTIQTYILQVRRKLRAALLTAGYGTANDILTTRRNGYLLDVAPDDVDAARYERLSANGRRAMTEGDYRAASRVLHTALNIWRGPAMVDVPTGPHMQIEAVRLEESRLSDLELRIDADLRLGRHHDLLRELAMLRARHPMLENFGAQYMIALYRSGRQSQALEVYRGIRHTIVDQLGVEPSPRLRRLHQAMLSGESVVDDPNFAYSGPSNRAVIGVR
jgi:DNA-binding SARP family transcriptional activator